jgi:two-component system, LytTR family, response regulator
MACLLLIDDSKCKKELDQFLEKNTKSVLIKSELEQAFETLQRILNNQNPVDNHSRLIAINSASNIEILKIQDIIYCQSYRSYTQLHLKNGTKLTATKTLKQFDTTLRKHGFIRIHQSHLVNMNCVQKYIKGENGFLLLSEGTKLPVSLRKKERLFKELERL